MWAVEQILGLVCLNITKRFVWFYAHPIVATIFYFWSAYIFNLQIFSIIFTVIVTKAWGSLVNLNTFQMDDIKNNYKFKQGEIFKRMKVSTFVQLVIQVSQESSSIVLWFTVQFNVCVIKVVQKYVLIILHFLNFIWYILISGGFHSAIAIDF